MANYLGLAVKEMGIIYHIKPKEVIYFGFFHGRYLWINNFIFYFLAFIWIHPMLWSPSSSLFSFLSIRWDHRTFENRRPGWIWDDIWQTYWKTNRKSSFQNCSRSGKYFLIFKKVARSAIWWFIIINNAYFDFT